LQPNRILSQRNYFISLQLATGRRTFAQTRIAEDDFKCGTPLAFRAGLDAGVPLLARSLSVIFR